MLRTRSPVRLLTHADVDAALELCAQDLAANVFVASRIAAGALGVGSQAVLGFVEDRQLSSLVWTQANVVPVQTDARTRAALAVGVRRARRRTASLLGPADQVLALWDLVDTSYPRPRSLRPVQPLLATRTPPSRLGVALDHRVRPARLEETDLIVPVAAHMFTEEIGYPPYQGSSNYYRESVRTLIALGRTYAVIEGGEVIFKADVGSCALGALQIQGVWLTPRLRGQGLATAMMAATIEQAMADHAPYVTLYVNDYNAPALATYLRCGMEQVGTFATVLL
ncbi:GNAT family N-acetyltransferase [Janibacter sp. GXQ6167]|uniref:GNAT family N-acetyltransferase n=1 Tax=Janibacter sp. GXQ6167 TaxID=3240791 RepID=UPI003523BB36